MLFETIILLLATKQTLLVHEMDVIRKPLDANSHYHFVISNRLNAISLWTGCY